MVITEEQPNVIIRLDVMDTMPKDLGLALSKENDQILPSSFIQRERDIVIWHRAFQTFKSLPRAQDAFFGLSARDLDWARLSPKRLIRSLRATLGTRVRLD